MRIKYQFAVDLLKGENMKVEFIRDLPIKAEPIDDYYDFPRVDRFDVSNIEMGQSSTSIELYGCTRKRFNSIHFKFYFHNKEINIYDSGLFNTYRWQHLPMIKFVDQKEKDDKEEKVFPYMFGGVSPCPNNP
jgi:hypothetical protein